MANKKQKQVQRQKLKQKKQQKAKAKQKQRSQNQSSVSRSNLDNDVLYIPKGLEALASRNTLGFKISSAANDEIDDDDADDDDELEIRMIKRVAKETGMSFEDAKRHISELINEHPNGQILHSVLLATYHALEMTGEDIDFHKQPDPETSALFDNIISNGNAANQSPFSENFQAVVHSREEAQEYLELDDKGKQEADIRYSVEDPRFADATGGEHHIGSLPLIAGALEYFNIVYRIIDHIGTDVVLDLPKESYIAKALGDIIEKMYPSGPEYIKFDYYNSNVYYANLITHQNILTEINAFNEYNNVVAAKFLGEHGDLDKVLDDVVLSAFDGVIDNGEEDLHYHRVLQIIPVPYQLFEALSVNHTEHTASSVPEIRTDYYCICDIENGAPLAIGHPTGKAFTKKDLYRFANENLPIIKRRFPNFTHVFVEESIFSTEILKIIKDAGFEFLATVPATNPLTKRVKKDSDDARYNDEYKGYTYTDIIFEEEIKLQKDAEPTEVLALSFCNQDALEASKKTLITRCRGEFSLAEVHLKQSFDSEAAAQEELDYLSESLKYTKLKGKSKAEPCVLAQDDGQWCIDAQFEQDMDAIESLAATQNKIICIDSNTDIHFTDTQVINVLHQSAKHSQFYSKLPRFKLDIPNYALRNDEIRDGVAFILDVAALLYIHCSLHVDSCMDIHHGSVDDEDFDMYLPTTKLYGSKVYPDFAHLLGYYSETDPLLRLAFLSEKERDFNCELFADLGNTWVWDDWGDFTREFTYYDE